MEKKFCRSQQVEKFTYTVFKKPHIGCDIADRLVQHTSYSWIGQGSVLLRLAVKQPHLSFTGHKRNRKDLGDKNSSKFIAIVNSTALAKDYQEIASRPRLPYSTSYLLLQFLSKNPKYVSLLSSSAIIS